MQKCRPSGLYFRFSSGGRTRTCDLRVTTILSVKTIHWKSCTHAVPCILSILVLESKNRDRSLALLPGTVAISPSFRLQVFAFPRSPRGGYSFLFRSSKTNKDPWLPAVSAGICMLSRRAGEAYSFFIEFKKSAHNSACSLILRTYHHWYNTPHPFTRSKNEP